MLFGGLHLIIYRAVQRIKKGSSLYIGQYRELKKGLHRNDVIPASCRDSRRSLK